MSSTVLLVLGAVFILLYAALPKRGIFLIPATGLIAAAVTLDPASTVLALAAAGALLLVSVIALITRRGGGVGIGAAPLIAVGVLAVPLIGGFFAQAEDNSLATAVAEARTLRTAQNANVDTSLSLAEVVPDPTETAEVTRVLIEPTITPTPFTFVLPTPVPARCEATVNANLRFREDPSLDAAVIDVIPETTIVNVFDRDGDWIEVEYNDERGWVSIDIVTLGAGCTF